jgi:ATP/maltotriose-dependent transcriptional regulator MalT
VGRQELFDYIAGNVIDRLSGRARLALIAFSLCAQIETEAVHEIERDSGDAAVRELELAGLLLHAANQTRRLHPLVRDYVLARFRDEESVTRTAVARRSFGRALRSRDWDAAFVVVEASSDPDLLSRLLRVAHRDALDRGRHATVERWLAIAPDAQPLHQLVSAEIALSAKNVSRAESLALLAGASDRLRPAQRAEAFAVAGLSAFFASKPLEARRHYEMSRTFARSPNTRADALWGIHIAAMASGDDDAPETAAAYAAAAPPSGLTMIRTATSRLNLASRALGWIDTLDDARIAAEACKDVRDPRARTSFWCLYACVLTNAGLIDEAAQAIRSVRADAAEAGARFAEPYADFLEARLAWLLRRFTAAESLLTRSEAASSDVGAISASCFLLRMIFALSRDQASSVDIERYRSAAQAASAGIGETHAALLATTLAAAGREEEALSVADSVLQSAKRIDAENVALFARGIADWKVSGDGRQVIAAARACSTSGDVFSLVLGYRAAPFVIPVILEDTNLIPFVRHCMETANDSALAERNGLALSRRPSQADSVLSPREREVFLLINEGLTNKEIARHLFISEATAKLHVRHILAKTGARSRTQLIVMARP